MNIPFLYIIDGRSINNEQETINDEQDRNSKIRKLGEQDDIKLWEAVRSFVVEILKEKKKSDIRLRKIGTLNDINRSNAGSSFKWDTK